MNRQFGRVARFVGTAFLVLCAPDRSAAQTPLTLAQVVQAALARHPSLTAAHAAVERASAGVGEARAARRPALSLDATAMHFAQPMVVAPLHGFDPRNPPLFDETLLQGSLSASYTLFDGGRGAARVRAAEAATDAAGSGEAASRLALLSDAAQAFLGVLAAREVVNANEHRVDAVEEERGRAAKMFEEGRSPRVAVLRADAALSAARADLAAAQAEERTAEGDLARVVGVDPDSIQGTPLQDVQLVGAAVAARGEITARAVAGSPEVRRLRAQIVAARAGQEQARSLWLPKVQVVGRYIEYASSAGVEAGEWQGGVQLSYPLITGGERGAAVDRAAAETRISASELRVVELRVQAAVDRAFAALQASRARMEALASGVEQAREVVRIERLALENGAGLQVDYLAAVAESLRIRSSLAQARYAEIAARIELARLTGDLSAQWLIDHLEPER